MIDASTIATQRRRIVGLRHDTLEVLAAVCLRELRKQGRGFQVPAGLANAYSAVKIAEIMQGVGASDAAISMAVQREMRKPTFTEDELGNINTDPKGTVMSQVPMPKAPYAPPTAAAGQACLGIQQPTPEERIKQAQEALADAEHAKAQADALKALEARLNYEQALCSATAALLGAIRTFGHTPGQATSRVFAEFRKELTPLAESYGYKLVPVGDKTQATLTKL